MKKWNGERDEYFYEWKAVGRGHEVKVEAATQRDAARFFLKMYGFEPDAVWTTALISAL